MDAINLIYVLLFHMTFEQGRVSCTIDVNMPEFEYIAAHLDPFECRRLVAALHYNSFVLPDSMAGAERKVAEDIPCLRQLLHWNNTPGEGRGQTHNAIEHRLRQLNRSDLADWLGKTTFRQLTIDLDRAMEPSFATEFVEVPESTTYEPSSEPSDDDPWLPIDTFLLALSIGLFISVVVIISLLIVHCVKRRRERNDGYKLVDGEREGWVASKTEGMQLEDEMPSRGVEIRRKISDET